MIKVIRYLLLTCLLVGIFGFSSESDNWVPVLMKRSDLVKSIESVAAKPLRETGKIYFYQSKLFVVERYKGVHIIDNSDPSNPVNVAFIQIPGCVDVATKGKHLMADNAVDLVAIDIEDINNVTTDQRLIHVFPELIPPGQSRVPNEFRMANRPKNTVIVNWKKI